MIRTLDCIRAVERNLEWFRRSGVMLPADGMWGVAERVAVTNGNSAIEKMLASFPAWTLHEKHAIIEQRRADCNFEAAFYFLTAHELTGNQSNYETALQLLDYLYFRSGLFDRTGNSAVPFSWNWSHIKWSEVIYFDDNAWCVYLQLLMAARYPELERRYGMRDFALKLAEHLRDAMTRTRENPDAKALPEWRDPENIWRGDLSLPHWGSLGVMALAEAYAVSRDASYLQEIRAYSDYVQSKISGFNASEQAYALIGSCAAFRAVGDDFYAKQANTLAESLLRRMDERGNLPSEHREAPIGNHLVDTVYTLNWVVLGLQMFVNICAPDQRYADALDRSLTLLLEIQDDDDSAAFAGCWRGMYDLKAKSWGGGDCYEGGAGSIYTGWTNAPIGTVLAFSQLGRSF